MAKTDAKERKRRSKAVTDEVVEEEDSAKTEGQTETLSPRQEQVGTEEDAPKEDQDEDDSQMDTVIEVKGNVSTVTVSWDQKTAKKTNGSDQMMDSADAVGSTEDDPNESAETEMRQEIQESGESQMDVVTESTDRVTESLEKENEEGENNDVEKETSGGEEMIVEKKAVAAKRKLKARSTAETSASKKTKVISEVAVKGKQKQHAAVETPQPEKKKCINTGFCLYVGNLDKSKKRAEVEDSLAKYLMTQSVLVNGIRVDQSRKFAYVDLASEMDLTKVLKCNGEMLDGNPMEIARARAVTKETVKASVEDQKEAKDGKCLFVKNIPYLATKDDILNIFRTAVNVRFLGGTERPEKGVAFVEFQNKTIARKLWQRKQGVQLQGRILSVDRIGATFTKAAAPPNKSLFVHNLPPDVKKKTLNKLFQNATNISLPKHEGKARGFAFVMFANLAEARKALESTQNVKIGKKLIRVQFAAMKAKAETEKVKTTLIVMGLSEKTTAETLKSVFEGAVSARISVDRDTGLSKRYGFVDFDSEDACKAVKEAMEDCEIDGSKVTVTYAKMPGANRTRRPNKPRRGPILGLAGDKGGRKSRGKSGHGRGDRGLAARMPKKAVKMLGNNKSSTPECPPFIPL
ncbi:nucleolin-like isoform X3 [Epinephelus fuscoguttatus]|uniref:nucleolin-like isoform X3 n=1 Tax=Epinephelus fuscoguttatus TaxID=293821 RepID=UPI0020D0E3FB|nr:nucleolin-like isoform X3 [Epinephelus fuscoguttatus]